MLLRAGDERTPTLTCVHPVTGRAEVYRELAARLDWPGPIHGIDAPVPVGDARLVDLAARYAEQLDLARPVLVLGWSIGGVIAAELARLVVARGGTVGFLGLIDTRAPVPEMRARPVDRAMLARAFLNQAALSRELDPIAAPPGAGAAQLLEALRTLGVAYLDEAAVEQRFEVFGNLVRAFYQHDTQPVPVPIHLFEAADAHPAHPKPPTLGWDALAPRVEHHAVPGTHYGLLGSRHVDALAQAISRCLPR